LVTVLEPHFEKEEWREVIPLAAALGGKATEALIQQLTELVRALDDREHWSHESNPLLLALGNCLADEVAARPKTIRAAMCEVVRLGQVLSGSPFTIMLTKGRYGALLLEEARNAFLKPTQNVFHPSFALRSAIWWQAVEVGGPECYKDAANRFLELLTRQELIARCEGALGVVELCQRLHLGIDSIEGYVEILEPIGAALVTLLFSDSTKENYVAVRALIEIGRCNVWDPPAEPDMIGRLFTLWRHSKYSEVQRLVPHAICGQRLVSHDSKRPCTTIQPDEFERFIQNYSELDTYDSKSAALMLAYYMRTPWSDAQLAERARDLIKSRRFASRSVITMYDLLALLGEKP
jgi:hypothetical protein